jgi:P-type conjugative transfer ATPase TrbB
MSVPQTVATQPAQLDLTVGCPDARDRDHDRTGDALIRYLGPAVTRAFADDDVTEVYVNPQDGIVRTDTRSRGKIATGVRLPSHRVEMFLNAVAASTGATLTREQPRLQAELPAAVFHGSRLQGFIAPLTPGPSFTIRKPPTIVYTLDDYVKAGHLSQGQRDILGDAVTSHRNILVVGGTNSGKTTLVNAVLREITDRFPQERIVILEDTVELQCSAPDHLALRTGPQVTLAELVRSTLRTSPDRIIVGEVRGPEALDLLDAWATGHPGGVATVHASSPEGALLRLDRLAQRSNVPPQAALIADAIDVIALIQGGNGGRRVTDLVHVTGLDPDGRYILHRFTTSTPCEPA